MCLSCFYYVLQADLSIFSTFVESGIGAGDLALIIILPIVGVVFIVILAVALYCVRLILGNVCA